MSKKHVGVVQRQFTRTCDAFSKYAVRDSAEVVAERVAFAKPEPQDIVLDVACGPGAFVLAVAPLVRFARGIDVTPAMLTQAKEFQRERQIANACFDQGEAERLPYPDAAFNLVTCHFACHHMQKPEAALKEMHRAARTDGRLMIVDTIGPESDEKWDLHNRIEIIRDPSHTASLRLTTFLKIFDGLGFEILRQSLKRRPRSFNDWMLRAGIDPSQARYKEARKLIEDSMPGDRAGFSAQPQGEDLQISHYEGVFLLKKR
jgi:ubiquinone/menaquinone biosynthesis C-methylase UbiE